MSFPAFPGRKRNDSTSSSASVQGTNTAGSPHVVSYPQQEKLIQDIQECITDLKSDYEDNKIPINDDNQQLHRLCAKLEHLLRTHMKDKFTMLGKKKDYWDYFCDCLGSTKGLNDGIKYVKTVGEYKTSVGKGRAFLRFSLMHNRMADSIQACVMNGKVTSDWFNPKSIWLQHGKSSALISSMYDLSDLQFDLAPRGYDLDNAWPSFARKNLGNSFNWNPPSRADSMSSLNSIPVQDQLQNRLGMSNTPNDSVDMGESIRSDLMDQIDALEQQKRTFQQSVITTQGEMENLKSQQTELKGHYDEVVADQKDLQQRLDRLKLETEANEKEWTMKENMHQKQLEQLETELSKYKSQVVSLESKLSTEESSRKNSDSNNMLKIVELDRTNSELQLQVRTLTQDLSSSIDSDNKKSDIIKNLEDKNITLDRKNQELLQKMENVLVSKNDEASSQINSTSKLQDALVKLKDAESALLKKEVELDELTKTHTKQQEELEMLNKNYCDLQESKDAEMKRFNTDVEKLNTEIKANQTSYEDEVKRLKSEIEIKEKSETNKSEEIEDLNKKLLFVEEEKKDKITEIGNLTEKLNQVNSEFKNLKKNLEENIVKLEADLNNQVSLTAQTDSSVKELQLTLESSQTEREIMKKELHDEKVKVSDLLSKIQNEERLRQELETKCTELEKDVENLSEQQKLEKGSTESIQQTLQEKMKQIKDLEMSKEVIVKCLNWISNNVDSESPSQMPQYKYDSEVASVLESIKDDLQHKHKEIQCLSQEQVRLQQLTKSLESQLNEKDQNLLSTQEKVTSLSSTTEALESQKTDLDTKCRELEKLLENNSQDKELLTKDLQEKKWETDLLTTEVERLKVELIQLQEMFVRKSSEVSELTEKSSRTEEKLQQKAKSFDEVAEIRKSLEEKVKQHEKLMSSKSAKIEDLETNVKKLQSVNSALEKEKDDICVRLKTSEKEKQVLQENLGQSAKVTTELEEKLKKVNGDKDILEEKRKELQTHNFDLEQKLGSSKEERNKQTQILDQLETERKKLMTNLEDALSDLGSIKEQLNQTSSELEKAYIEKEKIESERIELASCISEKDHNVKNLEESCENFRSELSKVKESESNLNKKCQDLVCEKDKLIVDVDRLTKEMETIKSEFESLKMEKISETEKLSNTNEELQEKIRSLTEENNELKKSQNGTELQNTELSAEKELLVTKLEDREKELTQKLETIDALEKSKTEMLNTSSEVTEKLREKDTEIKQMEESYDLEVDTLKQQISALEFQLSSEQIQHEHSLQNFTSQDGNITELKDKLTQQEALIENLEREMKDIQTARDLEKKQQCQQLEDFKSLLELSTEEKLSLNSQLSEERKALENERSLVHSLKTKLKENEDTMQKSEVNKDGRITELKSDNDQLKKKLIKLIREKDNLWQKTDQLAYQQKVKATEKWVDDKDVLNCMGCNTTFSFTIRKHHCRLCGRVFCFNCSNNFVMTTHSSKKSRACNLCYKKLQEIDELNSSLADKNSDDEIEQSVELPHRSCRRPMYTTDNTENRTTEQESETPTDSSSIQSENIDNLSDGLTIDGAVAMVPGQVAADITISMVSENDTDEVKEVKKLGAGSQLMNVIKGFVTTVTNEVEQYSNDGEEAGERKSSKTDVFHVISDDEIERSLTQSEELPTNTDPNLSRSMTLSAEELEKGQINNSNEVWVKAGKKFAVPILIEKVNTTLCWEFTSQPKDIVFCVNYKDTRGGNGDEVLVPSCKCDSHKQAVKGELTAKQGGIYTLYFDNTYSRMTQKKINYNLWTKCT